MSARSTQSTTADAAIALVNYRTPELVERCLASIRATCGNLSFETVIVDNNSEDGSVERLRAALPDASVVSMPSNAGFAAGVNAAFAHTQAELVVLLNPDTEVRPGALQVLLTRMHEHPRAGIVAPLLEGTDGKLAPNGYRRFPNLVTLTLNLCVPVTYALCYMPGLHFEAMPPAALLAGETPVHVTGAALAIRRLAYEQAGPFDEGFFLYLEETEWQRRVRQSGWDIEIAPDARVCHLVRGGGDEALAPSAHFVKSAVRYLSMRGVPPAISRLAFALSLTSSWATLRLIACLPTKRARARWQARAYLRLLRELW